MIILRRIVYFLGLCASTCAQAQTLAKPDMGKLLATGGVMQIEGAGGGGITPWALIAGYGSADSYGYNAHLTQLNTQDYRLISYGAALGIADRFELTLAHQEFSGSLAPLDQLRIAQDIFGVKLRLAGDAVLEQDRIMPQVALGALAKKNRGIGGLDPVTNVRQLGATSDQGVDYYLAASKIYLDQSLLLNATLRLSKANQMGLLGFGGDLHDRYRLFPEASAVYLLNRKLALGAEYRMKPHNLALDAEKAYADVFAAWFPNKNLALTVAYASLGDITRVNPKTQRGYYVSLQIGN